MAIEAIDHLSKLDKYIVSGKKHLANLKANLKATPKLIPKENPIANLRAHLRMRTNLEGCTLPVGGHRGGLVKPCGELWGAIGNFGGPLGATGDP